MAIVPVIVKAASSNERIATYAFLDNGCGAVFAESELCESLNLTTRKRSLLLKTLNHEEVIHSSVVVDKLQVGGMDGRTFIDLPEVYIKNNIPITCEDMSTQEDVQQWPHLSDLPLPKLYGRSIPKVTMIIGIDVPAAAAPLGVVTGRPGDPYAIKTSLGWVVYGVPGKPKDHLDANYCKTIGGVIQDGLNGLEHQLKASVSMDFSERQPDESDTMAPSREDLHSLHLVNASVRQDSNHYEMDLPENEWPSSPEHLMGGRGS